MSQYGYWIVWTEYVDDYANTDIAFFKEKKDALDFINQDKFLVQDDDLITVSKIDKIIHGNVVPLKEHKVRVIKEYKL